MARGGSPKRKQASERWKNLSRSPLVKIPPLPKPREDAPPQREKKKRRERERKSSNSSTPKLCTEGALEKQRHRDGHTNRAQMWTEIHDF